ncbi:MAG: hypothetical protein IPL99_26260 [Candidatus Competibacteraceae bacterium]|nr:hypothetical protein [Candidatus Competibacteraceae bacterium]
MYVHPTLAVTPEGVDFGVLDAWMWARGPEGGAPSQAESTRWVEGYEIVADLAETVSGTPGWSMWLIEGDLRALMDAAARRGTPADWADPIPAHRNTPAGEKLWDWLARSESLGRWSLPCRRRRSPGPPRAANPVRER